MPINRDATEKRNVDNDERLQRDMGPAAGALGGAFQEQQTTRLMEHLDKVLAKPPTARKREIKAYSPEVFKALKGIPTDTIAAAMLRGVLNCLDIVGQKVVAKVLVAMGNELQIQARGVFVRKALGAKEFARLKKSMSHKSSMRKKLQVEYAVLRDHAIEFKPWSRTLQERVGAFACDCLLRALPDVIVADKYGLARVAKDAWDVFEINLYANPIYEPSADPPPLWFGFDGIDGDTFVAACRDEKAVRAALRKGIPHMDAVNHLQMTRFRINEHALDVVRSMRGGIYASAYVSYAINKRRSARKQFPCVGTVKFLALLPDLLKKVKDDGAETLLAQNLAMADRFAVKPFYIPLRCDFRGRLLAGPNLNYTGPDHIRGLFKFDQTAPITERGLYWLKVACATAYDEYKEVSKQTFDKRLEWTESNLERICAAGRNPMNHLAWLVDAGDPIQCVAFFNELANAIDAIERGLGYHCSVPIGFDASCSGLQHFALLARDVSAAGLTNLIPTLAEDVEPWTGEGVPDRSLPGHVYTAPQDIYGFIRGLVQKGMANRTSHLAKWWLGSPIRVVRGRARLKPAHLDRKIIKSLVMTYGYSAQEWGQKSGVRDELWRRGVKIPNGAVPYLVKKVRKAIETHIPAAPAVMKALQALVTKTTPVHWISPSGLPVSNSYPKPRISKVRNYIHNRTLRPKTSVGWQREQRFRKAQNAIAPNYVHSLDSSHLALVANACAREDIPLVSVHDSFNVLPPHADRLREILLAELRAMYANYRTPVPPTGDLDLNEVTGDYAFS